MGISLSKGGRIDLSKEAPSLTNVGFGLGWDENDTNTGSDFDLDASVFMLGGNGKIPRDEYFIFYNNLKSRFSVIVNSIELLALIIPSIILSLLYSNLKNSGIS